MEQFLQAKTQVGQLRFSILGIGAVIAQMNVPWAQLETPLELLGLLTGNVRWTLGLLDQAEQKLREEFTNLQPSSLRNPPNSETLIGQTDEQSMRKATFSEDKVTDTDDLRGYDAEEDFTQQQENLERDHQLEGAEQQGQSNMDLGQQNNREEQNGQEETNAIEVVERVGRKKAGTIRFCGQLGIELLSGPYLAFFLQSFTRVRTRSCVAVKANELLLTKAQANGVKIVAQWLCSTCNFEVCIGDDYIECQRCPVSPYSIKHHVSCSCKQDQVHIENRTLFLPCCIKAKTANKPNFSHTQKNSEM